MSTVTFFAQLMVKAPTQKRLASTFTKVPSSLRSGRTVFKSFDLKFSPNFKASMATYNIKLVDADGNVKEFEATEDTYILDAADETRIDLSYSYRAGACSTCTGPPIEIL